jgi:cell division protein ZapA (FtsZ GTPase activity inhibitor)
MPDATRGDAAPARSVTVKILGKEYRVRSDADAKHLEEVAAYVDRVMREIHGRSGSDTQAAAILAALNIASDLVRMRELVAIRPERIRSLIELLESV